MKGEAGSQRSPSHDVLMPLRSRRALIDKAWHSGPFQEILRACTTEQSYRRTVGRSVFLLSCIEREEDIPHAAAILKRQEQEQPNPASEQAVHVDMAIALVEKQTGLSFSEHSVEIARVVMEKSMRTNFHGTNVGALEGIERRGLSPQTEMPEADTESIRTLQTLANLDQRIVGQLDSTSQRVYLTKRPEIAYDYALKSPEWFNQLLMRIEEVQQSGNGENPLQTRDYAKAKNALETALVFWKSQDRLSGDQEKLIRTFFESNWQAYASSEDAALLIVQTDTPSPAFAKHEATPYRLLARLSGIGVGLETEEEMEARLKKETTPEMLKNALRLVQEQDSHLMLSSAIPPEAIIPITFPLFKR